MTAILLRIKRFTAFIIGAIYFISGILKLLDPVGSGLVMQEYFNFLHISFLDFAAKVVGCAFAFAEAVIGIALITGVWRKLFANIAIVVQICFTFLTLILLVFQADMDCGCFGEAVELTHSETFIKNLLLLAFIIFALFPVDELGSPKKRKYASFSIVSISTLVFTIYSWLYIPLVDYTDYCTNAKLACISEVSGDDYEMSFTYEKDGRQENFTLENLPDSSWSFVSSESVLKDGVELGIPLSIMNRENGYEDEIAAEGKVMVISVYDTGMRSGKWDEIARFTAEADSLGFRPLVLLSSAADGTLPDMPENLYQYIYYSDYKTLITLNRSNGGATYFDEGVLVRKWAYIALPDAEELGEMSKGISLEYAIHRDAEGSLCFQGFLLFAFAIMLLF